MKYFTIISLILAIANALDQGFIDQFMEKMQKIGEECSVETKASAEDIADLISHKVPPTHEGKCMIFCFHKHFHIQREDGSVDKEGAIASLDKLKAADKEIYDKVVIVFKTCGDKVKPDADPCITAANLADCALVEGKAVGLSSDMFSS